MGRIPATACLPDREATASRLQWGGTCEISGIFTIGAGYLNSGPR